MKPETLINAKNLVIPIGIIGALMSVAWYAGLMNNRVTSLERQQERTTAVLDKLTDKLQNSLANQIAIIAAQNRIEALIEKHFQAGTPATH